MPLGIVAQGSHSSGISSVICHNDRVITGCDDGTVKVWNSKLEQLGSVQAHQGAVLSIAVHGTALYTCSNDETLQSWQLDTLQNIQQLQCTLFQPQKIYCEKETGILWGGDNQGNVAKYENGKEAGKYELAEEIWDLLVSAQPTCIYTARDRDVVICEVITGTKTRVMVKKTMEGRSPMCFAGNHLCFLDRSGRNICIYQNSLDEKFPKVGEIVASDLILNALCYGPENFLFSGGYDNTVKRWDITTKQCKDTVNIGNCVNALASPSENEVFVATSSGAIIKVANK